MHMKEIMLTLQEGHHYLMEMSCGNQHSGSETTSTLQKSKISPKELNDHHKVSTFLSYKVYHLLLPFFLKIMEFYFYFLVGPLLVACGILVPQPATKPGPPVMEVQSPNHWTTREFPK